MELHARAELEGVDQTVVGNRPAFSQTRLDFGRTVLEFDKTVIANGPFRVSADWSVAPGSRIALIGPSGAGKTTILSAIAGFLPMVAGALRWQGRDLAPLPPGDRPVST